MSAAGGDTRIDGGDSACVARMCMSHIPPGVRGGVWPCSRERTAPRNGDDDEGVRGPSVVYGSCSRRRGTGACGVHTRAGGETVRTRGRGRLGLGAHAGVGELSGGPGV